MKITKIILLFILWFITVLTISFISFKIGLDIRVTCFITFIVGIIFGIITGNIIFNGEDNNIIKVERPLDYYEVFNREESVKEMTVEQISKALGYEVKIVKDTE